MNSSPIISLSPPYGETRILLHACCAPCSSAIVECMVANGLQPTLFFFNPNIHPKSEYLTRKEEAIRFATAKNVDFIDADYVHEQWLEQVRGLEAEPERGLRCLQCFLIRLSATADSAATHAFRVFTTTLASSRWKDIRQINFAGRQAASAHPGLVFWEQNWRKGGLQDRRNQLLREYAFYNQQYCGCEFSLRAMQDRSKP